MEFWPEWEEYLGLRDIRNRVPMRVVAAVIADLSGSRDNTARREGVAARRAYVDTVAHHFSMWGVERMALVPHAAYLVRAFEAETEPKVCALAIVKTIQTDKMTKAETRSLRA